MRSSPYRKIPTAVWSLGLDATERDVFFWVACGPLTTSVPGLVRAGSEAIAAELRRPVKDVRDALASLELRGLLRVDPTGPLLWRVDAIDDDPPANDKVVKGWRASWAALPRCALLLEAAEAIASKLPTDRAATFREFAFAGFANRMGNGIANGTANRSPNGWAYQAPVSRKPQGSGIRDQDSSSNEEEGALGNGGGPPPEPAPLIPDPVVMTLPLQAGGTFAVTEGQLSAWAADFEGVDVIAELRKLRARWDADPMTRPRTRAKAKVVQWLTHAANFAARDAMRSTARPATARRISLAEQQLAEAHELAERMRQAERSQADLRLLDPRGSAS